MRLVFQAWMALCNLVGTDEALACTLTGENTQFDFSRIESGSTGHRRRLMHAPLASGSGKGRVES